MLERGETVILLGGPGPDGLAQLRFHATLYSEHIDAYLQELYVAPAQRGQGLGRALLEASIQAAREEGAAHMELVTGEDDAAARALYESAGFSNLERPPDGTRMLFYERDL
jgi:ribosomal protein S18 acetylase RimI-like enzyme